MSLAELLNLGSKKDAKNEQAVPAPRVSSATSQINQKEQKLLNEQLSRQAAELSRAQAQREKEEEINQKRELEEAAEQAAALARRRRETGASLSLEAWHNAEEIWHPSVEPNVFYPSVYVSDIPIDYTEDKIRELHRNLGLNPDLLVGLKFLPLTKTSLGSSGVLSTGSVMLRYRSDAAAQAVISRMKGHPVRTSTGERKHLGARLAAPAKWMTVRKQNEGSHANRPDTSAGYRQDCGDVAKASDGWLASEHQYGAWSAKAGVHTAAWETSSSTGWEPGSSACNIPSNAEGWWAVPPPQTGMDFARNDDINENLKPSSDDIWQYDGHVRKKPRLVDMDSELYNDI